jgi:hypothetical protein
MSVDPTFTTVLYAPITIDYTTRDFYSLREDIITRVKDRVNTQSSSRWYGNDPNDFGVALIEVFSYVGDMVSYYIDRIANESNILTASQRNSVINLARSYGYKPTSYTSATCTVQFTNASATTSHTVPAGTQVYGYVTDGDVTNKITYYTPNSVVVAASTTVTATFYHGEQVALRTANHSTGGTDIPGETLGSSDGSPFQVFRLNDTTVVQDTIEVYVLTGSSYGKWTKVDHMADYGPQDAVYTIETDGLNNVYIRFGDNVSGSIPNIYATIKTQYISGGGVIGNIPVGKLKSFDAFPEGTVSAPIIADLSVTNTTAGVGGLDPESTDSIRVNAPAANSALNRAVTLDDYTGIAYQSTLVGKANSEASVWTSVTVYVAPIRDITSLDVYPGKDETNTSETPELVTLKQNVLAYITPKLQIGVTATVSGPTYSNVALTIKYAKNSQYSTTDVETGINNYIKTYYSYYVAQFQATITPEEIEGVLRYVPGVESAKVTAMYRAGETVARTTLLGRAGEIFIFQPANTTLTALSSDATLSALSITNTAGLSPSFGSTVLNYAASVNSGSTSVAVTATTTNSNATVRINGSTSPHTVTTAANTTTNITITVTAEDGMTTKTYTIAAVRGS